MMNKMINTLFVLSASLAVAMAAYGDDFATINALCTDGGVGSTPQSPIAVNNAAFDASLVVSSVYTPSQFNISYTDYSWVANGFSGVNTLSVADSNGVDVYHLNEVSFKWGGSEHTYEKHSFAGEMQIKHTKGAKLMMMSVLFKLDDISIPGTDIVELTKITDLLDGSSDVSSTDTLDLGVFVDQIVTAFKYDGSLTTPSCDAAGWLVSTVHKKINTASLTKMMLQLDASAAVITNNIRPVAVTKDAYTGRKVTTNQQTESVAYLASVSRGYQFGDDTSSTLSTSVILFCVYMGLVGLVALFFLPPLIKKAAIDNDPKIQAAVAQAKHDHEHGAPARKKEEEQKKEKRTVRIHVDPEEDDAVEMAVVKNDMAPVMESMKEEEEEVVEEEAKEEEAAAVEEEKEAVAVEDVVVAAE